MLYYRLLSISVYYTILYIITSNCIYTDIKICHNLEIKVIMTDVVELLWKVQTVYNLNTFKNTFLSLKLTFIYFYFYNKFNKLHT